MEEAGLKVLVEQGVLGLGWVFLIVVAMIYRTDMRRKDEQLATEADRNRALAERVLSIMQRLTILVERDDHGQR